MSDLTQATFRCNDCRDSRTLDTSELPMRCPECDSLDIRTIWPAEDSDE